MFERLGINAESRYEQPEPYQGHELGGRVGRENEPWRTSQHMLRTPVRAKHVTQSKTQNPKPDCFEVEAVV